jgi:hypothetical protein
VTERPDLDVALLVALRPLVAELVEIELERRLEELAATDWLTLEETGPYLRTTVEALRAGARRGQLPGAVKDGSRWLVHRPTLDRSLIAGSVTTDNKNGQAPR